MDLALATEIAPAPHAAFKLISTERITFGAYDGGVGPAVVLLHGFPEIAFSWRHQIGRLIEAGWRVIAPDLRGYGRTGVEGDLSAYSMRNLSLDVVALLDALNIDQAAMVGHDFGGALAWSLARDHAKRVRGVISLNTPYTRRTSQDLAQTMLQYRGPTNYMVQFQEFGRGESLLERDVEATFRGLMRKPRLSLAEFHKLPGRVRALPMTLFVGGEPDVAGAPLLTDEEVRTYVDAFRRTGFSGGLNWYRNLHQNWLDTDGVADRIERPALMVTASDDFFLPPETASGMEHMIPDLEVHTLRCGHWTQQELPAETTAVITDWLARRMAQK